MFEASKGRLKVVGRAGVGIDNVDLAAASETGCLVVNGERMDAGKAGGGREGQGDTSQGGQASPGWRTLGCHGLNERAAQPPGGLGA